MALDDLEEPAFDPASIVTDDLVSRVIQTESAGNPKAVGPDTRFGNAIGLMQILPTTAADVGKRHNLPYDDLHNADQNKALGTQYLKDLATQFKDEKLTVAAYNYGPGAVRRLQKKYGNDFEDIADHLPDETKNYVSKTKTPDEATSEAAALPNEPVEQPKKIEFNIPDPESVTNDKRGFAQSVLPVVSNPEFDTIPFPEKLAVINQIYRSKPWPAEIDDLTKGIISGYWDAADPDELPKLGEIIPPPPRVAPDQDPAVALKDWRESATKGLIDDGISPVMLGSALDKYLDEGEQNEAAAFEARNRGMLASIAGWTGNSVRQGAVGAATLVSKPIEGVARLTGATETADAVAAVPQKVLGTPARDYLYVTDDDGYLKLNKDGTPQTRWQLQAAEITGNVGGMIAGGFALKAVGLGTAAVSGTLFAGNSLGMANDSFKTVLDDTGDEDKAYTAAVMSLPAAAIGSIGELAVISKALSPALRSMTKYDQARYVITSFAKKGTVEGAANAASDVAQQGAEISQTGKEFSGTRTAIAGGAGFAAGGVLGAAGDYVGGRKERTSVDSELTSFRDSINQTKVVAAKNVPKDLLDLYGMEAAQNLDGTNTITKRTTVDIGAADIGTLVGKLREMPTPNEVLDLAKKHAELSNKPNKTPEEEAQLAQLTQTIATASTPEYLNNVNAIENAVVQNLADEPGALMVRHLSDEGVWQHVETGKKAKYLKDLLVSNEPVAQTLDVSDISHIEVLDEDVLNKPFTAIEDYNAVKDEHDTVQADVLRLKNELDARKKEVTPVEALDPKATEAQQGLQSKLDSINSDILALQNRRDETPTEDKDARKAISEEIKQKTIEKRDVQRQLLKIKPSVDVEEGALAAQKSDIAAERTSRTADIQSQLDEKVAQQRALKAEMLEMKPAVKADKDREAKLKEIRADKKKSLGSFRRKNGQLSIHLRSGVTPENKPKVKAHEIAHAITDDVKLPKSAHEAAAKAVQKLRDKAKVASVKTIADEFVLPGARDSIEVADVPFSKLDKESQKDFDEDFLTEREFLANQIGAVMLKREGIDIGNYKILPEIEDALKTVKLPTVKDPVNVGRGIANAKKETPFGDSVQDPHAERILKSKDFPQVEEYLKTKATIEPEVLGSGLSSVVYDIGNGKVARLGEGAARDVSGVSNVIQPIETKQIGNIRVEILPKADTTKITDADVATVEASLQKEGYTLSDAGTDNVGRVDGKLTVLDPYAVEPLDLRSFTGEQKETAFSKRFEGTGAPKDMYEAASRVGTSENAADYVAKNGLKESIDLLSTPESAAKIEPASRVKLSEAALLEAERRFNADHSYENRSALDKARQLRSTASHTAGQTLGLMSKLSNTKDWASFYSAIQEAYRDAGMTPPDFTEYMLSELKARYEPISKLPESKLKTNEFQKLFDSTLKNKGISWAKFTSSYIRTNLLSGVGTQVINFESGNWMGPIFTALAHPLQGGGLVWRAMWNVKDLAIQNAKAVLHGPAGQEYFDGMVDTQPIAERDYTSVPKALASMYNKFGSGLFRVMGAADAFNTTLAKEGYVVNKRYKELKAQYKDQPQKFTAEVGKLVLSSADKDAALTQARNEIAQSGTKGITDAQAYARAYEILQERNPAALQEEALDWGRATSIKARPANALPQLAHVFFNNPLLKDHPVFGPVKNFIQPFGNAIIALADFTTDVIPGNIVLDKAWNKLVGAKAERSPALKERLYAGQMIGSVGAAAVVGLSRAGLISITGEAEKQTGEGKGKSAATRADFKEAEQTGIPEYSVIFPGGYAFKYKDFPGLNAVLYGVSKMNERIDKGESVASAAGAFYSSAFKFAIPFYADTSLNAPVIKLVDAMMDPDATSSKLKTAFDQFALGAAKMATPASSMLRDIQKAYDSTPEESHQPLLQKIFKDVPIASTLVGSIDAVDRFGDPIERTVLDRIPGAARVASEVKEPSDLVWAKLQRKSLIVPEMGNSVSFTQSDVGGEARFETYKKTREERLGAAYAKALTPDEWNDFRKATGPFIKKVADSVANADLETADAQKLLTKRVRAIETQAMKNYVATGKFE